MKKRVTPFIEYASESTIACLVTMTQGNIMAMSLGHLLVASETGLIAGAITATSIFLTRSRNRSRWMISVLLGFITGIVDFFVHPGAFGSVATEAVVTGVGAAVLSHIIGTIAARVRRSKFQHATE